MLPDPYAGHGDGIGSCECSRCDCCGAGPDECDCGRDWDELQVWCEDDDAPTDHLCNDPGCDHLRLRLERKAKETATS